MRATWAPPLKVWHNGVEWVIADSAVAAGKVMTELSGYDAEAEGDHDGWEALDGDSKLTISYENINDDIPEWGKVTAWFWACDVFDDAAQRRPGRKVHGHNLRGLKVTATAREWLDGCDGKPGFLCSTEF